MFETNEVEGAVSVQTACGKLVTRESFESSDIMANNVVVLHENTAEKSILTFRMVTVLWKIFFEITRELEMTNRSSVIFN